MATTGPFSRTEESYWSGSSGPRKTYHTYTWMRNGPGPKVPHYFRMARTYALSVGDDAPNLDAGYWTINGVPSQWASNESDVHNRAYDRFISQARSGASASLGATMAEWGQSQKMIGNRAGQLMRAARALKRGLPYEFFRELGMLHRIPRRMPNRTDPKKAADLWLEWWFGWKPLIGDIHESIKILEQPIPSEIQCVGKASSGLLISESSRIRTDWRWYRTLKMICRERIAASVQVTNPNLYRATQLGLTNPASVLWEIVPFSFVVDWFLPVGNFLEGWTDLLGLTLVKPHTTKSRHFQSTYQYISTYPAGSWSPSPEQKGQGWKVERDLHILGPELVLRPYKGISLTRAATAISLLVQQLNNLKR